MADEEFGSRTLKELNDDSPGFLHFAGARYWTASLLPALVGTTLPFWLRPPGFSFRWFGAIEFLVATLLLHAGFSFLHAWFENRSTVVWTKPRLLIAAGSCIVAACLLGLHLNSNFNGIIFIVFGMATIFAGVLYVVPPFSFFRQIGGEVVICEALGMIPVLGAYLVQTGDLTRTVYLASIPLIVATALWVLTDELITRKEDEKKERQTAVILFGAPFVGRFVVLALSVMLCATIFGAVFTGSMTPLALVTVLSFGLLWTIATLSWKEHDNPSRMIDARRKAVLLHFITCTIIAASSLAALAMYS